ncbi:hypothetical protein GP486_002767 [Trichoglossum hirsutum]|uniref:Endo-chitosanase n=1 Tax=Trichoglossum hirsutum TaxID=265104 RepID=A0A9P8LEB3_9PEZI|nr:hypothetical protein GP486_002767 [Trichoglossum hirsutum]
MRFSVYFSLVVPFVSCFLASTVHSRGIPNNLKKFYELQKGSCNNVIAKVGDFVYCGDCDNAIFLKGSRRLYDNMDIDCDGLNRLGGKCSNDPSGQGETSFKGLVKKYSRGAVSDLDASKVPYVVFGNEGGRQTFDPRQYGMKPLSVMAVVCGNNLVYGIWGDTNGGVDTGEASISLAELCFPGEGISGDNGHDRRDVLYIGFTSTRDADAEKYNWFVFSFVAVGKWPMSKNAWDFERSISAIGDKLVAQL